MIIIVIVVVLLYVASSNVLQAAMLCKVFNFYVHCPGYSKARLANARATLTCVVHAIARCETELRCCYCLCPTGLLAAEFCRR